MNARVAPLKRWLVVVCALCLGACEPAPEPPSGLRYGPPPGDTAGLYTVAAHPLHNPNKLVAAYSPLMGYLNARVPGARFELEASRDYAAYEDKIRDRAPAFLLANPWQALLAMKHGYHVIAMAGDAEDYKGLFITRVDSDIRTPADLKGRTVSYPAPTAIAACVMQQWFLHERGIDVNRDIENRYVGSQESSIMTAYLGEAAIAATWPPPWRLFQKDHPREAAALRVIWETPALLNNAFMVRDDVPKEWAEAVRRALLTLQHTREGQATLVGMETRRFHPADDATYLPAQAFIVRFEREVRPVGSP